MDHQAEALALFRLTKDPLVLDAVRVLADPDHPHFQEAASMVERMVEARSVLFPPE